MRVSERERESDRERARGSERERKRNRVTEMSEIESHIEGERERV